MDPPGAIAQVVEVSELPTGGGMPPAPPAPPGGGGNRVLGAAPGEGMTIPLDSHGGAPPPAPQGKAGFVKHLVQYGPFNKIKAPSQATYFRIDTPRPVSSFQDDVAAVLEASLRAERETIMAREKEQVDAMMQGRGVKMTEQEKLQSNSPGIQHLLFETQTCSSLRAGSTPAPGACDPHPSARGIGG